MTPSGNRCGGVRVYASSPPRQCPNRDPAAVGLGRLMPDYEVRMGNVGRNIAEGRLGLLLAVLRAV